ncbi:uncharacterized protein VTP21DRAFT_8759 [Calcarisporiella thermophila]|uniref:uncharacterized protein n=1 Tax=Calcarisporiella thermophila TaxID=911321 RepID=UPI00374467E2
MDPLEPQARSLASLLEGTRPRPGLAHLQIATSSTHMRADAHNSESPSDRMAPGGICIRCNHKLTSLVPPWHCHATLWLAQALIPKNACSRVPSFPFVPWGRPALACPLEPLAHARRSVQKSLQIRPHALPKPAPRTSSHGKPPEAGIRPPGRCCKQGA